MTQTFQSSASENQNILAQIYSELSLPMDSIIIKQSSQYYLQQTSLASVHTKGLYFFSEGAALRMVGLGLFLREIPWAVILQFKTEIHKVWDSKVRACLPQSSVAEAHVPPLL